MTIPKPAHLGAEYAAQFADELVVAAYPCRPPYPDEVFEILVRLTCGVPRTVLELGSGPGEIARRLAPDVDHVDAVEPAPAMLALARRLPGGRHPRIAWHQTNAEAFTYPAAHYSLAVAAESLHWMDWPRVLPALARALRPGAVLAIVNRGVTDVPWWREIAPLLPQYSTNTAYRPYDLVAELSARGLFHLAGQATTAPVLCEQRVEEYVTSWHSRNGFSPARMGPERAAAFDAAVRDALSAHVVSGRVRFPLTATLAWGLPAAASPLG